MDTNQVRATIACWSLLTLCVAVRCSPVYPNVNLLTNPNFEPICSDHEEQFIESEGKASSILLEFNAEDITQESCMRILSAPPTYGFIVRLIRPKLRKSYHNAHTGPLKKGVSSEQNSTRTCPLRIFSSLEPLIPSWEVDPCQLEDSSLNMEDPVRLFQGRLRLVWEHGGITLASKLMVTVLGKGEACHDGNKHSCLKIGEEPLLCISKDLVCDGIRHCPYSNEYDSDEDYSMCWKRKKIDGIESELWEHWAIEVFRNLFAFDAPPPEADFNITTEKTDGDINPKTITFAKGNSTSNGSGFTRRNSTRIGINSDLSKYGPWGYLMLGMLLCGGALLICGLWASASQSAHNESEAAAQQANVTIEHHSTPPNYEELDPPPPYSVLFPNQKAITPESGAVADIPGIPTSTSAGPNTSSTPPSTTEITAS